MSKTNYRLSKEALVLELKRTGVEACYGWKYACGDPDCTFVAYFPTYPGSDIACPRCTALRPKMSAAVPNLELVDSADWIVV